MRKKRRFLMTAVIILLFGTIVSGVFIYYIKCNKQEVTGEERCLLVQYMDGSYYDVVGKYFELKTDISCNGYLVNLADQVNRPDTVHFQFTEEKDHPVFAVDQSGSILWAETLGKGEHTMEIGEEEAVLSFMVTDTEEKDFFLNGTGMHESIQTPLTGKRLSVLGDSLSAYYHYIPQYNRSFYGEEDFNVKSMWWSVLSEKTGMIPCIINASGGSGVTLLDENEDPEHPLQGNSIRCEALSTGQADPDVILVMLGANDYMRGVETEKIKEEYVQMVSRMKEAYPEAEIYLCTYFQFQIFSEEQMEELNSMIVRVAENTGAGLIDMKDCEINAGEPEQYFENPITAEMDGVHLNENGQIVLGRFIAGQILKD